MDGNQVFWIQEGEHALGCCLNWKLDCIFSVVGYDTHLIWLPWPYMSFHTKWCTRQTIIKFAGKDTVWLDGMDLFNDDTHPSGHVCAVWQHFSPLHKKTHPYKGDWRSIMVKSEEENLSQAFIWVPGVSTDTGWKLPHTKAKTTGPAQFWWVRSGLLHCGAVSSDRVSQKDGREEENGDTWTKWTYKQGHCHVKNEE